MSAVTPVPADRLSRFSLSPTAGAWVALLGVTMLLSHFSRDLAKALDMRWAIRFPSGWKVPMADWVSAAMKWLVEEATFGLFTFTQMTRFIAWLIERPYELALAALSSGWVQGFGADAVQWLPPLSWIAVTVSLALLGHYVRDWKLAALAGGAFLYLAVFGQWDSAMVTLASIAIAVPLGVAGGLALGITAFRHRWLERLIMPVLDLMQTIPIFAYLVPILFLFGFGPVAALIATIIYAMPPMVRITTLSLRGVDPEIVDFGTMAGCTRRQMMWRVLIPSARPGLMVGVNQVIMLSLNMVIIASMIGAGGLGFDVLASLRRLDIGAGLEAGIAIVVLAIALDRLSQGLAKRRPDHHAAQASGNLLRRHPRAAIAAAIVLATFALGRFIPAVQTYPEALAITTGPFWAGMVEWLNVNLFDTLEAIKTALLTWFLLPIKRFLLGIPWPWGILLCALAGWHFGRWKLALLCATLAAFIAVNGLWAKAMTTVYLCGASVIIATAIGVPLGIWAALSERAGKVIGVFIDTLQTLPSFVYLIPVVMLFRVGDFTAMIAVVLYALAPAVRYAAHGVRMIDRQLIEAGIVSGCTPRQLLTRIRLPLALPEILLGLNQTIMLALSMLVITALVGTRDLGQEVYIALTKADTGRGIVAGLSVAFIAIIADRLISASARAARKRYGFVGEHG